MQLQSPRERKRDRERESEIAGWKKKVREEYERQGENKCEAWVQHWRSLRFQKWNCATSVFLLYPFFSSPSVFLLFHSSLFFISPMDLSQGSSRFLSSTTVTLLLIKDTHWDTHKDAYIVAHTISLARCCFHGETNKFYLTHGYTPLLPSLSSLSNWDLLWCHLTQSHMKSNRPVSTPPFAG